MSDFLKQFSNDWSGMAFQALLSIVLAAKIENSKSLFPLSNCSTLPRLGGGQNEPHLNFFKITPTQLLLTGWNFVTF